MATITEDYVSFEIAKLLKKKGFNIACEYQYINCSSGCSFLTDVRDDAGCYYKNTEIGQDEYSAPTLPMVMKWLREVCGIIISIEFQGICPTWKWRIYIKSSNDKHTDFQHYNKYEEAVEAGIKYALENLI